MILSFDDADTSFERFSHFCGKHDLRGTTEGKGVAWYWQRSCVGASDGIGEMSCTVDDVVLGISTALDDGDSSSDHWSPRNGWKESCV